ncbi:MAG: universal stress protein [Clostridia bacterium]|nr:universal stress protein [Clostridia bacterium]
MDKMHVLVCVTGQKTCEKLIDEGDRLAKEMDAELSVVHVAKQGAALLGGNITEAEALEYLFQISSEHGADMTVIRSNEVVDTLASHAGKVGAGLMVMGSPRKMRRDITEEIRAIMPEMQFRIICTEE